MEFAIAPCPDAKLDMSILSWNEERAFYRAHRADDASVPSARHGGEQPRPIVNATSDASSRRTALLRAGFSMSGYRAVAALVSPRMAEIFSRTDSIRQPVSRLI